jgi:Zn-dependent protease/CBS domain-containing protein
MENAVKLGRVAGIEISVHYTWVFAFALIAWSLAAGFFPGNYPGWAGPVYWLAGALAALALFGSVLVHELSHSLVALARGQRVHGITLFLFGGVSNLETEAERPRDEFLVAIVGPLTSFALAGACWWLSRLLPSGAPVLGAILAYLAFVNVLLGVFNLLPGLPLDGGRVLRSLLWAAMGSPHRATAIASYVGQGLALLMILWGVWQTFSGNVLGGIWIVFLGLFLNSAAEAARRQQALAEQLWGLRVTDLMDPRPAVGNVRTTIQEFVFDCALRQGRRAMLVVEDDRLLGIVTVSDAGNVPRAAWAPTMVGAVMTPVPLKTVPADAELGCALRLLVGGTVQQLPVLDDGRLVGMLSRADVLRFLELRNQLHLQDPPRASHGTAAA